MSITTSQQISKYYDLFRAIDVTFTKEIIRATGLLAQQVYLKCMGEQWPCVVYTASFTGAKIIASVKPTLFDKIRKANNLISLRFCFKEAGKNDPVAFFVAGKVIGFAPYNQVASGQGAGDLQSMVLQYTQRPPDPLIEILGRLMEANVNSSKRREERILVTPDSMRKLGLITKETIIMVQGVPRKCILRDISFTGVKVIIVGIAKFLVTKPCTVRMEMEEPRESYDIRGTIVRSEPVEGRKDLAAVAIEFTPALVPLTYKMHLNDFMAQTRKLSAGSPAATPPPAGTGASVPPQGLPRSAPPAAARTNSEAVPSVKPEYKDYSIE
jgi:hypothetical protein